MDKKSIFDPAEFAALRERVNSLQPGAVRQWGKMTVAQMLAHANVPLEVGLGKLQLPPEGNFLTRRLLKWYVLGKTEFKRNLPTSRFFLVTDGRMFEQEKKRLLDNLDDAHTRGLDGPWAPHNAFGALAPEQWGTLTWLHLDHHLRQFSV
ncbi:MAG TPA: DUF1569 domain-containing protein [Saprospiraceae bacterium]|nr:DUF1569 domain-containing protein [Saprospiraceae bacterium]HNM23889.1 DUF1569 domain-containing protein [Saprospiraceae bacterium]